MFYTYPQNGSGGSFIGPAYVIIEADSEAAADNIAITEAGVYFDGISKGRDCKCCGDRWYGAEEPTEEPTIYGSPVAECKGDFLRKEAKIYMQSGEVITKTF